jgi:hypothetical protein
VEPRRSDLLCAAAIFVAAAFYFVPFAPWTRPVLLDAATWDHMAIETARGLVPYRDVFLHKTPGAALVGAVAAKAGMAAGIDPVVAVHALFLVLGAVGAVLLFALCRTTLPRGVAIAAAAGLFAYDEWVVSAIEGCSAKVATVVFGLGSMLAAERGRPMLSSVLGGCSVLCWQPGLAFLLGSWAATWRRGERRPARLLSIVLASLLPTVALLGWFAAHGAVRDFFDQAVLFNFQYIDTKSRTPLGTLRALARTIGEWNDVETLLAPAAVAGLLLRRGARKAIASLRLPVSLTVYGLAYGAMTFVSYQSWPDAILLGPVVATILATGLVALLGLRLSATRAAVGAIVVLTLAAIPDARPKFHPPMTLATQRERYVALAEGVAASDRVVTVSVPEFLIHTGRRNGWKWPYLWFGVDAFAAAHTAGGFDGILADLERDLPRLMLVGRLWAGPERARFEEWAAARYDVRSMRLFPHLRRPLRVYRLRSGQ